MDDLKWFKEMKIEFLVKEFLENNSNKICFKKLVLNDFMINLI